MIIFHYLLDSLINSFKTIFVFLPIIIPCSIIEIFSGFANRRFARKFRWWGIVPLALVGTPIHELSHAIVAFLTGHKIKELALFRPNRRTGELGHLTHSWNERNPFHKYIGNSLIAIAPFFGGSIILYFLTKLLLPELIECEGFPIVSVDVFGDFSRFKIFVFALFERVKVMLEVFFHWRNLVSFRFYIFVFFSFSISLHLVPSREDFSHFRASLGGLIFIVILLNLIFPEFIGFLEFRFVPILLRIYPLMTLATFFSFITFLASLVTFIFDRNGLL
jgi:hypothetical protein